MTRINEGQCLMCSQPAQIKASGPHVPPAKLTLNYICYCHALILNINAESSKTILIDSTSYGTCLQTKPGILRHHLGFLELEAHVLSI